MASLHPYGIDGHGELIYSNTSYQFSATAATVVPKTSWSAESGPYLITIKTTNSPFYSESWTGIMQWYASSTNSNNADDIHLTASGHARNNYIVYARFKRFAGNNNDHGLQIWASGTPSNTTNVQIYAFQLSDQAH